MKVRLIMGCPCKGCNNNEIISWTHSSCRGGLWIDDEGDIYCQKCNYMLGFILDMRFNCATHSLERVPNSSKSNFASIIGQLSIASSINGWAPNFIMDLKRKILKHCEFDE